MVALHPTPSRRRPQSVPGSRAIAGLALSLLCVVTAPSARALSLAEAERLAVERDAVLRQLAAESEAMRERGVAEGQLMDPKLRLGAVNVPVDSFSLDAEDMTMLEVGVVQEFKPGQSRQLSRKQMEQLAAAMDATALDRERIVRREVRKLWTQLAYVGAARALLTEQTSWVEQMRQSAKARYASGEGKQLDMLQAGLDAAMLREQQLDLDRDDAMYRSQLSFWLGADEAARVQPTGLSPRVEPEPLATLQARLTEHPAQLDYMRRIDAAHTAADVARELRKPAWMLDVSYGFRQNAPDGMSRPDMMSAMFTVGLPLFRGDRQDRAVSAARLEAQGLDEKHDDHEREMQA